MYPPDFLIIGAPKAGTTALYTYLRGHRQIFMPKYDKEPHYFAKDLHVFTESAKYMGWNCEEHEYQSLFRDAGPGQFTGEASVFYLYSKEAAAEIYKRIPHVKLIAILRRPDEAVYSLHQELINGGFEPEPRFEDAWYRDESYFSKTGSSRGAERFTYYQDVAAYATQLARYLEYFPKRQLKVFFFEDFAARTRETYAEALRFLGVDEELPEHFPVVNASQRPRNELIARWLRDPPRVVARVGRLLPSALRFQLGDCAYQLNMTKYSRPALPEPLRRRIIESYQKEIADLERLLECRLPAWLQ